MTSSGEGQVEVTAWARTDPGRQRSENQDSFLVMEFREVGEGEGFQLTPHDPTPAALEGRAFALGPRGALLLVADGMGGSAGGALASRTTVERVREDLARAWLPEPWSTARAFTHHLVEALQAANRELHELARGDPRLNGMGSTVTAAGLLGDHLYLAQVGDSRAYLVRDGIARQLTRDQSVVQELLDAGALTEEQASGSAHRHAILQAVGTESELDVDLTSQQARRGDTLIVCSDGLSGLVEPEELAAAAGRFHDPTALCEALLEMADARGAPDNVTVAAAALGGEGLEPPQAGDAVGRHPYRPHE